MPVFPASEERVEGFDWTNPMVVITAALAIVAGLATITGQLKAIMEPIALFLGRKPKLVVEGSFADLPEIGNTLTVANPTKEVVMISWWELAWVKRQWWGGFKIDYLIDDADFDWPGRNMEPHSRWPKTFSGESFFSTAHKHRQGRRLRLRLKVTGERGYRDFLVH